MLNICVVLLVTTMISGSNRSEADQPTAESQVGPATMVTLEATSMALTRNKNSTDKKNDAYIKEFIYQASEARIMDREEGKLAAQRGTSRALKDYGELMVKDQSNMLKDLTQIARSKKVEVASSLGESKTDGLSDLHQLHGESFDSKFIKMMILDHKRDVKKFQKATLSKDPDVQVFATKYLPIVKSHLEKIQSIRERK